MSVSVSTARVGTDHPEPVSPLGGTATVTVSSGDTVYYYDRPSVSASNNTGSLTSGQSASFTSPQYLISASYSSVQISVDDTQTATQLPASVVTARSTTGAPTTGTWQTNQSVVDSAGVVWTCTAGGTPGTWAQNPSLNVSTFLGVSQIIRPSGDTTGATDRAAINAALAAGTNTSFYLNGNYTVDQPILVQSGTTLVLADASITLAAAANAPIIANPSYSSVSTPAASNIHIRGIGRALLDYNGANQTEQTSALWNSCAIAFTNVSSFSIEGIQCQNSQYLYILMQACSNGRLRNLHGIKGATDKGFLHVDIGCSDISIDGITAAGTFADSVFSFNSVALANVGPTTPYANALVGSARNITNIKVANVRLASSTGMFCFFVDGSATISNVSISAVLNTASSTGGKQIQLGPAGYAGVSLAAHGSMANISVVDYEWHDNATDYFLTIDSDVTDVQISNIRCSGTPKGLVGNGQSSLPASYYPQAQRVKFTDANIAATSSTGALSHLIAGLQVTDLQFENVTIGTANGPILQNASDVTGVKLRGLHVGTLNANPFQSTGYEIGVIENFTYDAKGSSLTAIFPSFSGLKIQQPFPILSSGDTAPAKVQGSEINCSTTFDPTGGAATTGGLYLADGKSWNLVKSHNSVFRPGQIYAPLLFHYDAAAISGVSNGGAVARWPDSAASNALLQATSANQPTWVASDATLNTLPTVAFDGVNDFLQTGPLTPISQAQPFSLFIVWYFTALQTAAWVLQGSVSADTARYSKNGTHMTAFNGSGGATSTVVLAANTAYVSFIAFSANTGTVGENFAARASCASASSGSGTLTGMTLGAKWDGTSSAPIHVAELVGYKGLVSTTDYATIAAGLAAKYGVTLV